MLAASPGYDDGSASADYCSAPQSGQHQWPRDEKGKASLEVLDSVIFSIRFLEAAFWYFLSLGLYKLKTS